LWFATFFYVGLQAKVILGLMLFLQVPT